MGAIDLANFDFRTTKLSAEELNSFSFGEFNRYLYDQAEAFSDRHAELEKKYNMVLFDTIFEDPFVRGMVIEANNSTDGINYIKDEWGGISEAVNDIEFVIDYYDDREVFMSFLDDIDKTWKHDIDESVLSKVTKMYSPYSIEALSTPDVDMDLSMLSFAEYEELGLIDDFPEEDVDNNLPDISHDAMINNGIIGPDWTKPATAFESFVKNSGIDIDHTKEIELQNDEYKDVADDFDKYEKETIDLYIERSSANDFEDFEKDVDVDNDFDIF